ncbi:hypothetical protein [Rhizobium mongolense]
MVKTANEIWADGPSTSPYEPYKPDIREWGTWLEDNVRGNTIASRTLLKAVDTDKFSILYLTESGREGVFRWVTGNFSTQIAADTLEGIYIKANAIASSAGAWVRQGDWAISGVNPLWFGADATGVADSAAAIRAAVALGRTVVFPRGTFLCSLSVTLSDGQHVYGQGGPMLTFGTPSGYVYDHPTKILFSGTGTKEHTIAGATATTIANPAAGEGYLADSSTRGNNYKTNDYTVAFSAGFILGKGSGLHYLGIYPEFDGISGYLGSDNRLADNWDVGIWARNSDWWLVENCMSYGHWRKAALLVSSHDLGDGKIPSNEKGRAVGCHFQGFYGVSIRSPETVVGSNWGFAGTKFEDCDIRSLFHQSGHLATSSAIITPFASPSGCLEMSGDTMRGIKFDNATLIGLDDICAFFGKVEETFFNSSYQEAKTTKVSGSTLAGSQGSRIVGTANTNRVEFRKNAKYAVDFSSYQTRDSSVGRYAAAAGVNSSAYMFDDDQLETHYNTYRGPRLRANTEGWRILDEDNLDIFRVENDGRQIPPTTGGYVMPQYTTAELTNAAHAVNTTGKFLGKIVLNTTTGIVMRANGTATTATWRDFLSGNAITPV